MKTYPSIDKRICPGKFLFAFDKLDGSNVRVEWTRKKGFTKFGRRNGLLDDSNPHLSESKDLILENYGDDLSRIFKDERYEKATAFFEFHGPNSFAGNHIDEDHVVTLFDVDIYRKGLLEPKEFVKLFGDLDIPKILHTGPVSTELIDSIKDGTLEGMTFEGVVFKGSWDKKSGRPLMFKVKNMKWIEKLREYCDGNQDLYKRLV